MINNPQIVIAGASGFIGQALIPQLLEQFPKAEITALSRTQQKSSDPRVAWKACDLFSTKSLKEQIPKNIDLAIYLVHSMGPTAQLDQGSFADYDLILADNFSRVLKPLNIKQLVYIGGLIPEGTPLSPHLQSRLEVEQVFKEHKLPLTIIRAGMIMGDNGASFQILLKLVNRLPVIVCPKWTQIQTTPADLNTVFNTIITCALNNEYINKTYDIASCKPITYLQMMKDVATVLGKKRIFIELPFFQPKISRWWVCLITNTTSNLVYPLIESLKHPMIARKENLFSAMGTDRDFIELLKNIHMKSFHRSFFMFKAERKTVRSIQRLATPPGKTAEWVKNQYLTWLPQFMSPLMNVYIDDRSIKITLLSKTLVILELVPTPDNNDPQLQHLNISRGLIVAKKNQGELEFRTVLDGKYTLTAIHGFTPSIPWFIYKYTQANFHLMVMNSFGKHLQNYKVKQLS